MIFSWVAQHTSEIFFFYDHFELKSIFHQIQQISSIYCNKQNNTMTKKTIRWSMNDHQSKSIKRLSTCYAHQYFGKWLYHSIWICCELLKPQFSCDSNIQICYQKVTCSNPGHCKIFKPPFSWFYNYLMLFQYFDMCWNVNQLTFMKNMKISEHVPLTQYMYQV